MNQLIPLAQLVPSLRNVRSGDNKVDPSLKADIEAHGLLQNLVVCPAEGNTYQVVAGGRRLAVLRQLQKEGKLPADHQVPCNVRDSDEAVEISLAENIARADMHPADEYVAFARLSNHFTAEEIALRFGTTEHHVLQRLKLGRVAPALIDRFRKGELNQDVMEALTLTDDHKAQLAIIKAQGKYPSAYSVRKALTETMLTSSSKIARFVGQEAYEAAGGKGRHDLFKEEFYFEDATLVESLATEKLKAIEEKLQAEGWAWVTVLREDHGNILYSCKRIEPEAKDVPVELMKKEEALKAKWEALNTAQEELDNEAADWDEKWDELEDQKGKVDLEQEELEEQIVSHHVFTAEQKAKAGVLAYLNYEGKLVIERGLVKAGSAKEEKRKEKAKGSDAFSQSLRAELASYRTEAVRVFVANSPDVALDIVVFKAVSGKLGKHIFDGSSASFTEVNLQQKVWTDKKTKAKAELAHLKEKLPTEWNKAKSDAERFKALRMLTQEQKLQLLAYATAFTVHDTLHQKGSWMEIALSATGGDVAKLWRPTLDNFFSRVKKDYLQTLGASLIGKKWAIDNAKQKTSGLAQSLATIFAAPEKHAPDQASAIKAWLPEGMAIMPEEQAASKKAA